MCLGTLSFLYPVNLLFFKVMFLLKSMALMVKMSNSWVYGLPTEKFLSLLVGSTLIFGPGSLDGKGTTKQSMSVDQKVSMPGGQFSVFLKNDSKTFSEILHEARGS